MYVYNKHNTEYMYTMHIIQYNHCKNFVRNYVNIIHAIVNYLLYN